MISIGFIGTNGAGKSFACDYLKTKGFHAFSLSDIVRSEATKKGLEHTRENLIQTGNWIKETYGKDFLAQESFKVARDSGHPLIVFDSIRLIDELSFLKQQGTEFIGINASIKCRYDRITQRQHATDTLSFEDFATLDDIEYLGKSAGHGIKKCMDQCERVILNEGSINELHQNLDKILAEIIVTQS